MAAGALVLDAVIVLVPLLQLELRWAAWAIRHAGPGPFTLDLVRPPNGWLFVLPAVEYGIAVLGVIWAIELWRRPGGRSRQTG